MRRRLASWVITLAVVCLAGMRAGSRLDAPPHPGELARVEAGMYPHRSDPHHSPVARWFYGRTIPARPRIPDPLRLLPWARLAGVISLLAATWCLYLLVAGIRGRVTALLACGLLALLPPAGLEGYVLRPEEPAVLAGIAGVWFVALLPRMLAARKRRWRNWLLPSVAVGVVSGACFGLSTACLPQAGIHLLVPGGVLVSVTLRALLRYPRLVRRRGVLGAPNAALRRRILPWLVVCLVAMVVMTGVLEAVLEGGAVFTRPSPSEHGVLPSSLFGAFGVSLLAFVGGLRLLLTVGRRLGRTGEAGPDLVLCWWAAALGARQLFEEPGVDALPAALPVAALCGDGAFLLATVGLGALMARFAARGSPHKETV